MRFYISLQIWDRRFGKLQSRGMVSETTGHAGHSVSHIDVKMDCNYLISKATDDSIKLWDLRWFTSTKEGKCELDMYIRL